MGPRLGVALRSPSLSLLGTDRKEKSRLDLPMDVAPNGTLYYALDAVVPTTPGVYTMTMGVVRGYEFLCSMDVTLTVTY